MLGSRFREYVKARYQDWMRTAVVLPDQEKKASDELLSAALSASDSASESPSDTMFILMLIDLETRLNEIQQKMSCAR